MLGCNYMMVFQHRQLMAVWTSYHCGLRYEEISDWLHSMMLINVWSKSKSTWMTSTEVCYIIISYSWMQACSVCDILFHCWLLTVCMFDGNNIALGSGHVRIIIFNTQDPLTLCIVANGPWYHKNEMAMLVEDFNIWVMHKFEDQIFLIGSFQLFTYAFSRY